MKYAAILFVLSEVVAFTLWYYQLLPTIGVTCVLLGGLSAGLVLGNLDNPGKPLQGREARRVPSGLGSDVPMGGQSNSALLALMALIEARTAVEKSEMSYEEFAKEIEEYRVLMAQTGKSDECYELPTASYPMEMREL